MDETEGWLLDIYGDDEKGIVLWFAGNDGKRFHGYQSFPATFYMAGPFARLRQVWRMLRQQPGPLSLARQRRRDLFVGERELLSITVPVATQLPRLFHICLTRFPDLDYYDADIPLLLRHSAVYGTFPLARCYLLLDSKRQIQALTAGTPECGNGRWDYEPPPPLRILKIAPDCNPAHRDPTRLQLRAAARQWEIPLHPPHLLLRQLQANLRRHDPDIILTRWGDTWLFPRLLAIAQADPAARFNPNRDLTRAVHQRPGRRYFTYGQIIYRGEQVHLWGRWHIDQQNSLLFTEYGLTGILEQARVTGLPVQEIARKSPGAGITARQMQVALEQGILVPYQKQQGEAEKSARQLLYLDRGGLVYQPRIGLHTHVAEIDFVSMYPSIMVRDNISPETVSMTASQPGVLTDGSVEGLIPQVVRPLLMRRYVIKQQLARLNHRDSRYAALKAQAAALKWLLVVCFGYLGFQNARFGRIEAHEAVTAAGREALLQAKETAEAMGYRVLHMYVDGLWVQKEGLRSGAELNPLLDAIQTRTGLAITLEGVYRWIAFLPSRLDARVPVANRYFGVFQDGHSKLRGIAARRSDTPPFIRAVQIQLVQLLGKLDPHSKISSSNQGTAKWAPVSQLVQERHRQLLTGQIPLPDLVVTQRLSRPPDQYRVLSPAAQAARQLAAVGKSRQAGERVAFLFVRGEPGVHAWDLPAAPDPAQLDEARYVTLLQRAILECLQPWGGTDAIVNAWLLGVRQLPFWE